MECACDPLLCAGLPASARALALCHTINNSSKPQADSRTWCNSLAANRLPAVRSSRFALRLGGLAVVLGLTLFGLRLSSEGHAYGLRLSACGWLVTWLVGDRRGSVLPTPQSLLRSVYAGRLCVAGAIYLAAALKFAVAAPLDLLVTSFVLVAAVVVTIASYWYTHLSRRTPGRTFLYGQALFDVALITTVVHITGGPQSDLTPLYVPLIAVTAVLMPPASTGLITALVGIVYFADVFFGHTTPMTGQVGLQVLVFAAVAMVTAYFSSRVSVMGAEREALAGELRQARLEAADVLRSVPTGIVTVDQAGHLLYCNPAAEQIFGFKERQWRGRPIMPEFAKIAPEFWAAITATARRGVRAMRVEATVRRPDRTFPIGVTTTTLDVEPAGEPRVTAIFTDISDSKRLEELHLRAERLEAVAELSSSLAHEIKNQLASIRSSVEQLGRAKRVNADEKFLTSLVVRETDGCRVCSRSFSISPGCAPRSAGHSICAPWRPRRSGSCASTRTAPRTPSSI